MSKTLLNQISKYYLVLSKLYKLCLLEKQELLNHPKIIEYLFKKPIKQYANIQVAYELIQESYVEKIKMSTLDKTKINSSFLVSSNYMKKYIDVYTKYQKLITHYTNNNKKMHFKKPPFAPKISSHLIKIINVLDDLDDVEYIPFWSFHYMEEYLDAEEKKPFNFNCNLIYDFYCCLFVSKKMIQFVIKWDGPNINSTDIYALQLNMHILKLDKKSNLKKDIANFIKKISKSHQYIVQHNSTSLINNLDYDDFDNSYEEFINDYQYNHHLYIKYYSRINLLDENNSESENDSESDDILNYSEKADDHGYAVNNDILKSIMRKKFIFTK